MKQNTKGRINLKGYL